MPIFTSSESPLEEFGILRNVCHLDIWIELLELREHRIRIVVPVIKLLNLGGTFVSLDRLIVSIITFCLG
jgi:hypothetical protein